MKKLKYIYTLLIAMLLGIISFACTDDEEMEQDKNGDDTTDVRGGGFVTTTITVSTAAPNLSVDIEGTRSGSDNANIERDQTENGGRFQNVVVVVTNDKDSVYAIHCNKWYGDHPTSTGVKQYEVIFPDVQIYTTNGKKAKVYAFGNVDMDRWNTINGYTVEATRKVISQYAEINNLITADLSVINDDIYNIRFVPESGNYKVGDDEVTNTCTGMPVNGTADAEVKKGSTKFSVHMRRVCARLQVTFRNFTGTYKDYESKKNLPNKVYVDEFVIKKVLAKKTNYFHDSVAKGNNYTLSESGDVDFNILNALGGSKTNDHDINKIENGDDLVVSMYVFENKKGTGDAYTYNLKVDRGKNLGLKTTVIDPENAYVIWNNEKLHSIAYDGTKIRSSRMQDSKDEIPYSDQVFWKIEKLDPAVDNPNVQNEYILLPYLLEDIALDKPKKQQPEVYFQHQDEDQSKFTSNQPDLIVGLQNDKGNAQYVQFTEKGENENDSKFTMNLLNSKHKYYKKYTGMNWIGTYQYDEIIPYVNGYNCWAAHTEGYVGILGVKNQERYYFLTINDNGELKKKRSELFSGSDGLKYEWTLYAKYIIKKDKLFGEGKDDAVTQYKKITRNSSYSMDFSVMPNYEMKQELLVNCVRDQKTISWESVDK